MFRMPSTNQGQDAPFNLRNTLLSEAQDDAAKSSYARARPSESVRLFPAGSLSLSSLRSGTAGRLESVIPLESVHPLGPLNRWVSSDVFAPRNSTGKGLMQCSLLHGCFHMTSTDHAVK